LIVWSVEREPSRTRSRCRGRRQGSWSRPHSRRPSPCSLYTRGDRDGFRPQHGGLSARGGGGGGVHSSAAEAWLDRVDHPSPGVAAGRALSALGISSSIFVSSVTDPVIVSFADAVGVGIGEDNHAVGVRVAFGIRLHRRPSCRCPAAPAFDAPSRQTSTFHPRDRTAFVDGRRDRVRAPGKVFAGFQASSTRLGALSRRFRRRRPARRASPHTSSLGGVPDRSRRSAFVCASVATARAFQSLGNCGERDVQPSISSRRCRGR